jgi:arginyl-tRNA synthetase
MLSFDGNTAAYLLYAIARMKSILRAWGGDLSGANADTIETDEERNLARKLVYFPMVLSQAISELRPHHLCSYLFELTSDYSAFYAANRVIGEENNVTRRRIAIVAGTLGVMETAMHLLGLETCERL